jgi:hypothetical protein
MLHFNSQTMTAYRKNEAKRGYNPFDYPEEWEFFKHPFDAEEEDDILADTLFQIRKMTRRFHLYFDNDSYDRLETAFYFGLLDSLSETEDYLLGAIKYSRYCRLEHLFFLAANKDLGDFIETLFRLRDELVSKIKTFGKNTVKLNRECHDGDLFLHQYCYLTKNSIPDDMLRALLRIPDFPSGSDNIMKLDENTSLKSYFENVRVGLQLIKEEPNIEGACDSSGLQELIWPVDRLLWNIRGNLLWGVIKKIMMVCSNAAALGNRHNMLVDTMCKHAYEEVCSVYARSRAYAKRRDEELPRQCGEYMFIQERKPTLTETQTYFNTRYRDFITRNNQSYQLYYQYRKQENKFYIGFLNLLLEEDTRQDAEDFLFIMTYSKEINSKKKTLGKKEPSNVTDESLVTASSQAPVSILKVGTLITNELVMNDGRHPRFPECLSIEDGKELYNFLSKNRFIDGEKTPLADFDYLMGAATQYTTPNAPKPIWWLKNRQMLREMLNLTFAPLLNNGTKQKTLADIVPSCFVDKKGKPLNLSKNKNDGIVKQDMDALTEFFATILRPGDTI